MNDRIKLLRIALNLSQEEFGANLGVQKSAISKIERGDTATTKTIIKLICTTIWSDGRRVSESWLRHGTGEMFASMDAEDEIMAYINSLDGPVSDLQKRLLLMMARLNEDQWITFERMLRELLESQEQDTEKPDG